MKLLKKNDDNLFYCYFSCNSAVNHHLKILLIKPSNYFSFSRLIGSRRHLEIRVRATDPRPCPKCGKIYRSAHTLRTHLEDKHTVCPGYRCVLCGTVAKSRNSLHSHMSRQHRGISTKDLPVLPMPSPFDPELASRLLAKAGVKISPAELRARASPTSGTRRSDNKLELRGPNDTDSNIDEMDDPEDLTMGSGLNNNNMSGRYDSMMGFNHPNTTITRVRQEAGTPKGLDGKDLPSSGATGSSILDTYLQFITENTFGKFNFPHKLKFFVWPAYTNRFEFDKRYFLGMGMSQEQAAAALHAAKMAQYNALGHNFDKIPPSLLPPHMDLSKLNHSQSPDLARIQAAGGITIEPTKVPTSYANSLHDRGGADIRRDDSQPMDLGIENNQLNENRHSRRDSDAGNNHGNNHNNAGGNSSGEDEYGSDDDGDRDNNS